MSICHKLYKLFPYIMGQFLLIKYVYVVGVMASKLLIHILMINHIVDDTEMVKPKGGQLAKLSAMWCSELNFWDWLNESGIGISIESPTDAKLAVYEVCDIPSRSELDNNPEAAEKFHRLIRIPYMEYLKTI